MKTLSIGLLLFLGFSLAFGVGQIDIAYSPYTISNPGSYIVVKDLNTSRFLNAITIQTSNVFLDLNGHTLNGTGITLSSSTSYGIYGDTTNNNITIINGTIQNGLRGGIILEGNQIQINRVKTYINGGDGIRVGNSSKVSDCIIDMNRNNGLTMGNYGLVDNCLVSNNTAFGIYALNNCIIKNNTVLSNGTSVTMLLSGIATGSGAILAGNSCNSNGDRGIRTSYGSTITGNSCQYNSGDGIFVTDKCTLIGNTSNNNTGNGITVNNFCTIKDNTIVGNNFMGLYLFTYNQIIGNTISQQTSNSGMYVAGVHNRIDSNHICNNNSGICIFNATNWCGRNTLSYNNSNFNNIIPADLGSGFSNFTTF